MRTAVGGDHTGPHSRDAVASADSVGMSQCPSVVTNSRPPTRFTGCLADRFVFQLGNNTRPLRSAPRPVPPRVAHPSTQQPDNVTEVRVAYLINMYPAGSHTFVRREIHALERRGIAVERFALRPQGGELVDPQDKAEHARTRYVLAGGTMALAGGLLRSVLRSPRRFWRGLSLALRMSRQSERPWPIHLVYLAEACIVREWMAASGSTHLHAHFATNSAEVAMLAHALSGVPYSFTAHGSDIMDRPAQMGLPSTVGAASFVAAVCSFGRSQIFKWIPQTLWHKVHVIRCGLERGYGADSDASGHPTRRLLCIGRLSKEKGQLLLVQAAKILADEGAEFEIVLAGDGPMRATIESTVQELSLGRFVRLAGWLDAAGIQAELRGSRALVVPSLSEGLPVVIMEAMASGRPVVAPYLAGIPELVSAGRTGWLFPASDVEGLAAAMRTCLAAGDQALVEMASAARSDVWRAHDIDVEAGKLAALFSRAVPA
jgi:colanic acid/amylovoran biosynthesis glycosyltransferase